MMGVEVMVNLNVHWYIYNDHDRSCNIHMQVTALDHHSRGVAKLRHPSDNENTDR